MPPEVESIHWERFARVLEMNLIATNRAADEFLGCAPRLRLKHLTAWNAAELVGCWRVPLRICGGASVAISPQTSLIEEMLS